MNEDTRTDGWFAGVPAGDHEEGATQVRTGDAEAPADWPAEAIERGFASDEAAYYDLLHEATTTAARAATAEREGAADQQLVHAVRAMDDCHQQANELQERLVEWAGSRDPDAGTGLEYVREVTDRNPETATERRLCSLARRVVALETEATQLRQFVETAAPDVAPNLSSLAGPVLAARLLSLAGGLETLAKKPSGTVQVLGAEDALFAHLRGDAPSPKHGVIYTHEAVRGTRLEDRGSAARALAGKLSIAARIDQYSGDRRPGLERELDERIATIQAREDTDE